MDQDDLVHRLATIYKDVLNRFEVPKVTDLGIYFLPDLPYNSILTCFADFDATAEGSIKRLMLDIVSALRHKNRILMAEDADSYHAYVIGVAHLGDKEGSCTEIGKLDCSEWANKNALRAIPQGDLVFTMFR